MCCLLGKREERRLHQEGTVNDTGKLIALEIASELPDLWDKYPDGLTIGMLEKEFDLPYHSVHAAAVWLGDNGRAKWARRPDRPSAMLVPLDWEVPIYDLTKKQQAIVDALTKMADSKGQVTTSYKTLSATAGTALGSIVAHLEALYRKGYVEIVQPGDSNTKTTFRVYPEGDRERKAA